MKSEIHFIPTTKYKTNTITFFFIDNLRKETVTKNALVPAILRRGCNKHPSINAISMELEKLFGASFDCGVIKKGEYHIIFFYIECVSDNFITQKMRGNYSKSIFSSCTDLLIDIIFDPITENGVFLSRFLNEEKNNLTSLIESRINDKLTYAIDRCLEEMTKDEPFGIYEYGQISDLEDINENNLFLHYKKVVSEYPLKVFVSGSISEESIHCLKNSLTSRKIKKYSDMEINTNNTMNFNNRINVNSTNSYSSANNNTTNKNTSSNINELKLEEYDEKLDVNQAKLSIGFYTNTLPQDRDYYPLLVYNSVLDSGMNSKLYKNIREKSGLVYYILSQLEKFKGLQLISCGIDENNKEKTVKLIFEQIEAMKLGDISRTEYESALKAIETGINSIKDNQLQVIDFFLGQLLAETNDDFDAMLANIKNVTINDIKMVAQKVKPKLIYLLASGQNS